MEGLGDHRLGHLGTAGALHRLRQILGVRVVTALDDPFVSDLLVNPDGSVWVDQLRDGRRAVGLQLSVAEAGRIVHDVAAFSGTRLQSGRPILSVALGGWNAHFTGVIPPLVRAPSFAIHKFTGRTRSLEEYVTDRLLSAPQASALTRAVSLRRNIVISGGAGSGKTTLANALLLAIAPQSRRVVVLEREPQLRCTVPHHIPLRAWSSETTMEALLQIALRWQPDRLVAGQLEGPELPALLQLWQGACPGGVVTTTAGSARHALVRLEEVLRQAGHALPRTQVAQTVHVVVHLQGIGSHRRVVTIAEMVDADARAYRLAPLRGEA